METKIKQHYKSNFNSSPVGVAQNEIDFIIKQDCECNRCGKSIFELYDFPELLIEDEEIMCEECYDEHYREICPICENSYDVKDYTSDYLVITEELSNETGNTPGIYKILKRPFFYGSILSGFDAFFPNTLELVTSIRINDYKKIDCGENCCEVSSDTICSECVDRYVRKSNYIKSESIPCILVKRCEKDLFSEYTSEQLHFRRQRLIHKRITCRGMLEQGNRINI